MSANARRGHGASRGPHLTGLAGLAGLVALLAVPGLAAPATAHASSGMDVVTGGARDFTGANVAVSARSQPGGTGASGVVNATLPNPRSPFGGTAQFRLRVTCLAVADGIASIGAAVTDSPANDVFPTGTPFVITIRDSGLPGGDGDGLGLFPGAPADTCPVFLAQAPAAAPIEQGNLHVRVGA